MMVKLDNLFQPVVSEFIWAQDGGVGNSTDRIIAQVRRALFEDKLRVGDFLGTENELADIFGVSLFTMSSALRKLAALGIVEIKVGSKGGASVAPLNPGRFIEALAIQNHLVGLSEAEILDTLQAIEGKSAELAAVNATEEDIRSLTRQFDEGANLLDDPAAFTKSCLAFHRAVSRASHNRVIDAQFESLSQATWPDGDGGNHCCDAGVAHELHRLLISLIRAGDGSGAREIMLEHLAKTDESPPAK